MAPLKPVSLPPISTLPEEDEPKPEQQEPEPDQHEPEQEQQEPEPEQQKPEPEQQPELLLKQVPRDLYHADRTPDWESLVISWICDCRITKKALLILYFLNN